MNRRVFEIYQHKENQLRARRLLSENGVSVDDDIRVSVAANENGTYLVLDPTNPQGDQGDWAHKPIWILTQIPEKRLNVRPRVLGMFFENYDTLIDACRKQGPKAANMPLAEISKLADEKTVFFA